MKRERCSLSYEIEMSSLKRPPPLKGASELSQEELRAEAIKRYREEG
jgi:hypothetical protein